MKDYMFAILARWTTQRPWMVLGGVLLFTLAMGASMAMLKMEMNQLALMPQDDPATLEYQHISEAFDGGMNSITIALRSESSAKLAPAAADVESALQVLLEKEKIRRIQWKMPVDYMKNHAFMLVEEKDLKKLYPQTQNLNLVPFLQAYNNTLEQTYVGGEEKTSGSNEAGAVASIEGVAKFVQSLDEVLGNSDISKLDSAKVQSSVETFWMGDSVILSANRKVLLMQVQSVYSIMDSVFEAVEVIEMMEPLIDSVESLHPGVAIGMTGIAPIQKEEMNASLGDAAWGTALAFVLIIVLLVVSFRLWMAPLLAGVTLLTGIIWAAGIAGLVVGRLNMSTAFFGIYLIGLGIDFCIHYMHGYNENKAAGNSLEDSVKGALTLNGGSILTGGLTTAFAFLALVFTDFGMYQEMGMIAGLGIMSCVAATFLILPSVLYLYDRRAQKRGTYTPPPAKISEAPGIGWWAGLMKKGRYAWTVIFIALLSWTAIEMPNFGFNSNMMDLEPQGLEAVELQDTLLEAFDQSTETAMFTVPDLDSAWRVSERLRDENLVGDVQTPSMICPPLNEQRKRQPWLEKFRTALENPAPLDSQADLTALQMEIERLEANIIEMSQSAYLNQQNRIVARADRLTGLDSTGNKVKPGVFSPLFDKLEKTPPAELQSRLLAYQRIFKAASERLLHSMSNPAEIHWKDVPEEYQQQFLSNDGKEFLLSVYPKNDVWEDMLNNPFLTAVDRIVPHHTGMFSMMKVIYEKGRDEGRKATLLSLIAIFLLLALHFRQRIWLAFMAMIPMVAAIIMLIGGYAIFGVDFNMMSFMALPLIIGIGVDDGVHIAHRWLHRERMSMEQVLSHVGHAVLLTTLTTAIAFGSLVFGTMPANSTLGFVLLWGVVLCYVLSISLLPIAFSFFSSKED